MKTCPSCGRENPDGHDFCQCGEYLRWEPTSYRPVIQRSPEGGGDPTPANPAAPDESPPVSPPPGPPSVAPSSPSPAPVAQEPLARAKLVVRLPDGDSSGGEPVTVTSEPGGRATILGLLRNESAIVDNYELSIRGLPDRWWSISPPVAYLLPYGTSGADDQEFEVVLHPPRTAEAVARPWPFDLVAVSRAYSTMAASASAMLVVTPYVDISSEVRPERVTGRWRASYTLTVGNTSNAAAEVRVRGEDTDGTCRFRFSQQTFIVQPGSTDRMPFTVRPPRQIWVGQLVERQLSVFVSPPGAEKQPAPSRVTFRQRSWFPKWVVKLLVVLLLLLAAGVVAAVVIPDLTGHDQSSTSDSAPPVSQGSSAGSGG